MIIKEVFIQAISALIGHRIRAVMTMTGIAWGIVAVVLLMAYGNGFHNAIMTGFRRAFSKLGENERQLLVTMAKEMVQTRAAAPGKPQRRARSRKFCAPATTTGDRGR